MTEMLDEIEVTETEEILPENELVNEEPETQPDELEALRAELGALRVEIARRDEFERERERAEAELSRFHEYFPETSTAQIPDEVWDAVKRGESLAGAYSLYVRRGELEKSRIDEFNKKVRKMSAGSITRDGDEKYFSPAEVRKMTPAQVKKNYDDILESMRHWN